MNRRRNVRLIEYADCLNERMTPRVGLIFTSLTSSLSGRIRQSSDVCARSVLFHALDKYFPQHPHLPKSVKSSINDAGKTLYHSLDDTPMADVVHKISDNVVQAEHVVEGRFTSLRKIYSNYVNSWFSPISQSTDNYNILTDWKLYVGIIIFSGFCYFFMPWLYNSFFGSNKSMDNVRIHDDLDTPSRPLVSDIPD